MTDGGDGFGEVMSGLLGAVPQVINTCDAAHRPCRARWWWEPGTRTAIIESAEVIGLAMLPPGKFHPFDLDSYGLGRVLRAVVDKGARRCLVGLGGSATNDGGFGVARSVGWQFVAKNGKPIVNWAELPLVTQISSSRGLALPELVVAVDVQNPLLGPDGATRVYGPQKGLKPKDFALAERAFLQLAKLIERQKGRRLDRAPGAGAAGGLGFGFLAFFGGDLERGFDLFAKETSLQSRLGAKDLVITGEGAIDNSTFMGKGAGQVAGLCRKLKIPCIGLAGDLVFKKRPNKLFTRLCALTGLTSAAQAMREPARWLEQLAKQVADSWPKKSRHGGSRKGLNSTKRGVPSRA